MPYETGKKARDNAKFFQAIKNSSVKPLPGGPKSDSDFAKELHNIRPYPDLHMHGNKKYNGGK